MRYSWANVALLVLIAIELTSGFAGLTGGSADRGWVLVTHGMAGYVILAVLRWKVAIVGQSWRRRALPVAPRLAFGLLAVLFLATLATGLVWTLAGRLVVQGYSVMTIHVGLAIASLPFLAWHVVWGRFVFPAVARIRGIAGRRVLIGLAGATAAGLVAWQGGGIARCPYQPAGRPASLYRLLRIRRISPIPNGELAV